MSVELRMLVWAVVLGLIQIAVAATLATSQRGFAWGVGARDGNAEPLSAFGGRCARASANFLETFPLFAAAVLVLAITQRGDAQTANGAQLYFWARVAYWPAYATGLPYVRTIVWAASMVGVVMVLMPLF
jgi:uncharacterized MAPEG superfamily protein